MISFLPLSPALVLALFLGASSPATAPQAIAPDAGCTQQKGAYHCNWSSFKLIFERSHTVRVEAGPMDRSAAAQVGALVKELGKTRVQEEQAADLTMLLVPMDPSGVNLGPGDHDLATLRVYAPGDGSTRGTLLWAETLRGQGDRPWPAQVHALVDQFADRFGTR